MAHLNKSFADRIIFLCLFPLTYIFHIAEEYWGGEGYPAYLLSVHGVEFSGTRFLILQSIGIVLMVVGILIARRLNFPHLLLAILATVFLKNAITHIIRSGLRVEYEPGLVTSIFLWLPLGAVSLFHLGRFMSGGRFLLGLAIGLAICVAIELMTSGIF